MSGEIPTPAESGEVTILENPVSLNHALDVTPGAPRSSRTDANGSHPATRSSIRLDGTVAVLAAGALGGVTIFAGMAEAQGTTNPYEGAICNSPSPILSQSPSGMPSEAPFSKAPDGSPTLTFAPSPDASALPLASGETSAVSLAQAAGNVETSALSFPSTQEIIDSLIALKPDNTDKAPTYAQLKKKVMTIYTMEDGACADILGQISLPDDGGYLDKEFIEAQLKVIKEGSKYEKNAPERDKIDSKQGFSAGLAVMMVYAFSKTDLPDLKSKLLEIPPMAVSYGLSRIDPKHPIQANEKIDSDLAALAQAYVNYQIKR
jgi:hypothetical protein